MFDPGLADCSQRVGKDSLVLLSSCAEPDLPEEVFQVFIGGHH
jgi:hypothetical protein